MKITKYIILFNKFITITLIILLYNYVNPIFNPTSIDYPDHVHKTLYLDPAFTVSEINDITAAALTWSSTTNNIVKYDIVMLPTDDDIDLDNSIFITKTSSYDPTIIGLNGFNSYSKNTLAYYYGGDRVPYISVVINNIDYRSVKTVLMHELGHSLGLRHNVEIGTLMYPTADFGADIITPDDLINFCKLYHCDADKLKH